jgi:O-antigen ligase
MIRIPRIKHPDIFLHIFLLLIIIGAGLPLWREVTGASINSIDGDPLQRNIILIAYLLALIPLIVKPSKIFKELFKNPSLLFFLFWATLSVFWSNFPSIGFRRVIALHLTIFYAILLYLRFNEKGFLNLLTITLYIILISSTIIILFFPSVGIMSGVHEGSWRGIFTHKNTLGKITVLSLILFTTSLEKCKGNFSKYVLIFGSLLSLFLLIRSESLSAYLLTFIFIISVVLVNVFRLFKKDWLFLLVLFVLVIIFVTLLLIKNFETLLMMLGRDVTFTGRIPLWRELIKIGLDNPLGFGYGTFWVGDSNPSVIIYNRIPWRPSHAHNGYLDVWIQLGWIGLLSSLALVVKTSYKIFIRILHEKNKPYFWIYFLIFILTYNISESNLLSYNNIYTIIFFVAIFVVSDSNIF